MKPILLLYLKSFLIFGILFGIAILAGDLIIDHTFSWKFLRSGTFFGLWMSLILVSLHILSLKLGGIKKLTADTLGVRHNHTIASDISKEDLINKLKSDPSFDHLKITNSKDEIILKTGPSFQSWGETVSIHVKPLAPSSNEFEITSKPKLKLTILDFGRNLENVRRIEELIGTAG